MDLTIWKPKTDWARRAARTWFDNFVVLVGVLFIPKVMSLYQSIVDSDGTGEIDIDLNAWGKLLLAAMVASTVALFNALKNKAEDKTGTDLVVKK